MAATIPGHISAFKFIAHSRSLHMSGRNRLSGSSVTELFLDPGVRLGNTVAKRSIRLPIQNLSDKRIVAVSAGDTLWGSQIILAHHANPCNCLNLADQFVDRKQLAGTEIDGRRNQFSAVHDHVNTFDAVVNIHEAAGLFPISPNRDLARCLFP